MVNVEIPPDVREDIRGFTRGWWLFLVTGLLWMFVSLFILQFDLRSVTMIATLTGIVLFIAAAEEVFIAVVAEGWRWLHWLLAALFLFGGVWAFAFPAQTFGTLAILVSWFLLLKGAFDVVAALSSTDVPFWWFVLIVGIAEIAVAFWAIGYPGRSAWLLILWVGLGAMFRGIGQIMLAFQIKKLKGLLA